MKEPFERNQLNHFLPFNNSFSDRNLKIEPFILKNFTDQGYSHSSLTLSRNEVVRHILLNGCHGKGDCYRNFSFN